MSPKTFTKYEPINPTEAMGEEGRPRFMEELASSVEQTRQAQSEQTERTLEEKGEGTKGSKLNSKRRLEETWTWEALAIFWGLLCFAAVIIILTYMSDKSISSWKAPIGPNALVGVFSTLAKAGLMTAVPACISQLKWIHFTHSPKPLIDMQAFDDASRGPFGALLFFRGLVAGKGRSKASVLAAVGCLITILALALEPFTQQIISFRDRTVELPNGQGIARLAMANGYDTGANTKDGNWRPEATDDLMQGAILAGLFSRPIVTSAFEECSTSNCTWPAASSLSICSSCTDVTSSSTKNCTKNEYGSNVQDLTCNYTTPAKSKLQAMTGPAPSASRFVTLIDTNTGIPSFSTNSGGQPAMIASVAVLRVGNESSTYKDIYNGHIDECHIYWCKSTYTKTEIFSNGSRVVDVNRELLTWDENLSSDKGIMVDKANETSYSVNLVDMIGIGVILQSLFSTSLTSEYYQGKTNTAFSIAQLLYRAENVSSLIEHTAASMTARLRTGEKVTNITGTVMHNETYIYVNWAWITLPAIVAATTIIFMALTIVVNRHEKGWLWRNSVLPFMFVGRAWGVDNVVTPEAGKGTVSGMERTAAKKSIACDDFIKEG